MKVAFLIAEKPSLASSISSILSNKKATSRKGSCNSLLVHEWKGKFRGEDVLFKMTSVCGHVMTLDFHSKFNNWNSTDPVQLFQCPTEKKEANPKLHIPKFLSQEASGCSIIILWLDCDKEGENICFEVLDCILPRINTKPSVFRARFSSITEKEIKNAINNLTIPNENEARSVDARQELDLRLGCAFTRFQTQHLQGRFANLDSTLVSFGPCQTPTLGLVVARYDLIQRFKPEPYWTIEVKLDCLTNNDIRFTWERHRCFDHEVAETLLNYAKETNYARVMNVNSRESYNSRPLPLNTVELLKAASSKLGFSPYRAMELAEKLYTQGFLSYPRTETTQYSNSFDIRSTLTALKEHPDYGNEIQKMLNGNYNGSRKGHDAGDHPPITPLQLLHPNQLDRDAWKLYNYVCCHFLASISFDCRYITTTVQIAIGKEIFIYTGHKQIDAGYTVFMPWRSVSNETIPSFCNEQELLVKEIKLIEYKTTPPDLMTESELIGLMEKHGIGTDASIPVHINNLCQRNYMNVGSGRRLTPTQLGIILVHGYQQIDVQLVEPTMRAAVEQQLHLIATGKAEFNSVLLHSVSIFLSKYQYFVKHVDIMDKLFEASFSSLTQTAKPFCRCGTCEHFMRLVNSQPPWLHCATCDKTYTLPKSGAIRLHRELRCPLDNFELLIWSEGSQGRSFVFCPHCLTQPPFSGMMKGSGCHLCPHPTCPHGLQANGVAACDECDKGVLVLDPSTAPKWKLRCNQCNVILRCFEDAVHVTVKDDVCKKCGSQEISVEYKPEKESLPFGEAKLIGCIFCNPKLEVLIVKEHAIKTKSKLRTGKYPVRGRGRGRKLHKPKDKMLQLAQYFV